VLSLLSTLDGILIALAGSDLRPRVQQCLLGDRWAGAFHAKNEGLIRALQEALQCCGLRSSRDRAWPFPDRTHAADACVVRYGYDRSCEALWMQRERGVLVGMVAVGVVGLVVKASNS
jgi:hypothetical protein